MSIAEGEEDVGGGGVVVGVGWGELLNHNEAPFQLYFITNTSNHSINLFITSAIVPIQKIKFIILLCFYFLHL